MGKARQLRKMERKIKREIFKRRMGINMKKREKTNIKRRTNMNTKRRKKKM